MVPQTPRLAAVAQANLESRCQSGVAVPIWARGAIWARGGNLGSRARGLAVLAGSRVGRMACGPSGVPSLTSNYSVTSVSSAARKSGPAITRPDHQAGPTRPPRPIRHSGRPCPAFRSAPWPGSSVGLARHSGRPGPAPRSAWPGVPVGLARLLSRPGVMERFRWLGGVLPPGGVISAYSAVNAPSGGNPPPGQRNLSAVKAAALRQAATLRQETETLRQEPQALRQEPETLRQEPETLRHEPETLRHEPETLRTDRSSPVEAPSPGSAPSFDRVLKGAPSVPVSHGLGAYVVVADVICDK